MPTPQPNESKDDYMKRCIPKVLDDGTASSQDQAVAICSAMFDKADGAMKAGARNNKNDATAIQAMHDLACKLGATCGGGHEPADETPMTDVMNKPMKATGLDGAYSFLGDVSYNTPPLAIKIAGEMELDVCYMPYSGQKAGKDADGQYFSTRTQEHADKFPTPLVLYYHGYEARGVQQPLPEEIGVSTGAKWENKAGRWLRVKLDAAKEKAIKVWNSAQKGNARASSDSIAHLVRVAPDGEIINWPFVGISLFETETGKSPANSFAFARPAAKALGFDVADDEDNNDELKAIIAAVVGAALQSK
jgi:hypothetical protein